MQLLRSDRPPLLDNTRWDDFVAAHPGGHLLQLSGWGALKDRFGWRAARVALEEGGRLIGGAQVLFRSLPLGRTLAYVPKGPVLDDPDAEAASGIWPALHQMAHERRAILLKVEPEWPDDPSLAVSLASRDFRPSPQDVQPRRTIRVDLTAGEDEILARMKSKTRYNIRLAKRKGVTVRRGDRDDLNTFYALMRETGTRDEFGIHSLEYYRAAYDQFTSADRVRLLLACFEEEPLAGLMVFACGDKAWYFYGASSGRHRNRMPNYRLQWEAMRWAKARGCATYDLWGVPDADKVVLEEQFTERSDGLWGVYRFKRGFGGQLYRYVGAFDHVYSPLWYRLYTAFVARRGSLA